MGKDIKAPKWVQAFFHSFSQVVFVQNIISGALILLAFFAVAFNAADFKIAFDPSKLHIAILAIVAAIVGNVTAKFFAIDDDTIAAGLCGFCPVLLGAAAGVFFAQDGVIIDAYVIAILGSILVIPLQMVINGLCAKLSLPGFTFPFIVMTWFLVLVSQGSGLLTACGWMSNAPVAAGLVGAGAGPVAATFGNVNWMNALALGFSEIYILETIIGSILIFLAFAIDRWQNAIKLIIVVAIIAILGILFQANVGTLNAGVFSYNAILVFMGMETFSKNKDNAVKYWTLIILGLVSVFLVDLALPSIVGTFGLSNLTFPFVLVTWGLLFIEQNLSDKFLA